MILDKFPKERIKLPKEYQLIYKEHYLLNREGKTRATSISNKLESWMHYIVSKNIRDTSDNNTILEVGAGTLNHLVYERNIKLYDIVEPFKELYSNSKHLHRIRNVFNDIKDINENKYNHIISIATFEHIVNLPEVVAKSTLLLEKDGQLLVSIPNEGTLLWRMGTLFTGFEFKLTYGLDYNLLMEYEHVNTAIDIEQVLNYFFKEVSCSNFGINKNIAFYRFFNCTKPNIKKAKDYFSKLKNILSNEG